MLVKKKLNGKDSCTWQTYDDCMYSTLKNFMYETVRNSLLPQLLNYLEYTFNPSRLIAQFLGYQMK